MRTKQVHALLVLQRMVAVVALLGLCATASANPILESLESLDNGKLRFAYAARPGVQGNGSNVVITHGSHTTWHNGSDHADRRNLCDPCQVQVTLTVRQGEIRRLRRRVGARQRPAAQDVRQLGVVEAMDARDFLMKLVDEAQDNIAEAALAAAVLSEVGVAWEGLLKLARDDNRSRELRSTALFWLGQEAQEVVTSELENLATGDIEDLEVRRSAVFALSQRPDPQSIPSLQRIVKQHRHPEIRSHALFWLAQKESPQVTDFFEEILSGSSGR